jgi:hypothetical protein
MRRQRDYPLGSARSADVTTSTRQPVKAAPRPKMTRHETGVLGMQRRWGPHGRILRLDQLDPVTKNIVLAILDAQDSAKKSAQDSAGTAQATS